MKARIATFAAMVMLTACYRSHERIGDEAVDAAARDGSRDTGTLHLVDASHADGATGPTCQSRCTGERVVAHRGPSEAVAILSIDMMDTTLGVLAREENYVMGDYVPVYTLLLVSPERGTIARAESPIDATSSSDLFDGTLRVIDGNWVAAFIRSDDVLLGSRPGTAMFGAVAWSSIGRIVWDVPSIATVPETFPACACSELAGMFGRDHRVVGTVSMGPNIWSIDTTFGATAPTPGSVFALAAIVPDATSGVPLAGTLLGTGSAFIVGGGRPQGGDPRAPFEIFGQLADAPLAIEPLSLATYAPPPETASARDGSSAGVFYIAPPDGPSASTDVLHARAIGSDGAVLDEMPLTLSDGLLPIQTTAFAGDDGVGVAWAERSGAIRMLVPAPPSRWSECGNSIATPAVATAARGLIDGGVAFRSLLAYASGDRILLVLVEHDDSVTVLELSGCGITSDAGS